jgi:glucosamine-6-phosphate deaminase
MRLIIQPDYNQIACWTAQYIANRIIDAQPTEQKPFVLGLPTGSTPLGVYAKLAEMCQAKNLTFEHVVTFNMDEYVGIPKNHEQSYHTFMWNNFFSMIDIKPQNVNMLDGNALNLEEACETYEAKIKSVGGIDLFLGGVGIDGHIAFNEPGSSLSSRTRQKSLTTDTILANSRFFGNDSNNVPTKALTVGVATIMDAKEVLILASGHSKARAVRHAVEEPISHQWTISAIQMHPKAILVVDEQACDELKVGTYKYFLDIEKDNITHS